MKTTQTRMPFANPRTDVPKGQSKIAQRFIAGSFAAPRHVPKERLKKDNGGHIQSSLRDSNGIDGIPGVETPDYCRVVPSGHRSSNRANFRQVLECVGRAQRRRRFRTQSQRGVALRLPPQFKKPERGQPCPRETKSRHPRTKLSALLLIAATLTSVAFLLLCPASAHAQGGLPLWTNRYDGPGMSDDSAAAIAVDRNGNVFVAGTSRDGVSSYGVTIAYSNAGTPLWTNRTLAGGLAFGPGSLALDDSGNVFVAGIDGNDSDYVTIKYSNAGVPLWTNRYDASVNSDQVSAIAVDTNGNMFVTGYSRDANDIFDYLTLAYSNLGLPLWTNRYDGPANGYDLACAIAVDSSGNVFVTGESDGGPGSGGDYATIKYSNSGQPLWTNRYDGPGNGGDDGYAIAVDSVGNVFVTGGSRNGTNQDFATIKYSNAGVPLWTNRYNGPANRDDTGLKIAVDSSGNVIVTGSSYNGSNFDYGTVKYSNAGSPLWTNRYNGPANAHDIPSGIAVDSAGNVFVTGISAPSSALFDFATVAYSSTGATLWTKRYTGRVDGNDLASAIAVDHTGNVFVTGTSYDAHAIGSIVTIKYSSSIAPPRLDFQTLNNELVLSWTNAGFNLQSAPALTGPFTSILGASSPYTNVTTSAQQFFRLVGD